MDKRLLGIKVKELRKKRGLTQSALAGDVITRNMLSSIENGTAMPSIETRSHLADVLLVDAAYFLSAEEDLAFFEKKACIDKIYRAYEAHNYAACIKIISSLTATDNELDYILCESYFEVGKECVLSGSLLSATKHLSTALKHAAATKIDTHHIELKIPLYLAVAKNIQSPLLELEPQKYSDQLVDTADYEFFKYLTMDFDYQFSTPSYRLHMDAKKMIGERNYTEATKLLISAVEFSKSDKYNAYAIFTLYSDLELCYKQLYNFERAYYYSNKRMTLLEGFKI
ncbi:MAG: helix-turn-helix transcriptional regulator [Clostridia bacterium]|nr:helix-turn-helix transcriptional regulator [Clostridia bacterium]